MFLWERKSEVAGLRKQTAFWQASRPFLTPDGRQLALKGAARIFNRRKKMIVSRPIAPGEEDLLKGNERSDLKFTSVLNGSELSSHKPPDKGWTHHAVEAVAKPTEAWDAFLGSQWIGSSEV